MPDSGRQLAVAELDAVQTVDPTGAALVHGDLGGTNLLWTATSDGFRLTGVLDWDEAHIGSQADDLASLATMLGWPLAEQLDRERHGGRCPTITAARIIETTFALQQALPAALSGDAEALDDGLTRYTAR
jgi:aminoglycoside phosphotransferase (APT) family kinase protein